MAIAIARNYWALRFDMPWTICAANLFPTSSGTGLSGVSGSACAIVAEQNFLLLDLLRTRFWFVQWQHRFSIVSRCSALFRGVQQIEQVLDIHGANGFVRHHSYFPSDRNKS